MSERPPLTLSSLDVQRLEALLAALPAQDRAQYRALSDELERADLVEPGAMPKHVVTMNSTVRFRTEPDGKEFERTLVYPSAADGSENTLSILAPVGTALLGLTLGDSIAWPTPGGGTTTVRIMDILYQPEAAGALHR